MAIDNRIDLTGGVSIGRVEHILKLGVVCKGVGLDLAECEQQGSDGVRGECGDVESGC